MEKMCPRHYVIVVHGIGEQKENETATEVVHRFAEARHREGDIQYENLLPSYLSAQSIRRGGMGGRNSTGFPLTPILTPASSTEVPPPRPPARTFAL